MSRDFSNYKFVISSGCSYGRLSDYVFNPFYYLVDGERLFNEYGETDWLNINGDKIISLNLSMGSQGSDWQSDSLIYVVNELLNLGIKSENIYCLVEWSQWHRFSVHLPHHYGMSVDVFDFQKNKYDVNPRFNYEIVKSKDYTEKLKNDLFFFFEHFELYISKELYNIGKIQDRVYICPQHTDPNIYKNFGHTYKIFYDDACDLEHKYPLENKIKTYLDNILRTQYFLEKNNLKYNFCFMQSTLSEWGIRDDGVISHSLFNGGLKQYHIINEQAILNPEFKPKNDPKSDIEVIMPEVKTKLNQINFKNFWLYDNEKFRKGGIDEWAIDNLKETGYININNHKLNEGFDVIEVMPNYGEHPNLIAYILLWNEITSNCDFLKVKPKFEKFIWDKYWEDYNYNGVTKNKITISKKEWDKITKNDT